MSAFDPLLKRWPLAALIVSAAMLAIAHGFQTFGHLAPCHLCLKQREVYWAAMAAAGVAVVVQRVRPAAPTPRIASLILAGIFAYGAYLAIFQAGAEWKWWPAPQTCASTGAVGMAELKALLAGAGSRAPACDVAPWRLLGLSMAGWNGLISVGLMLLSLAAAMRKERAT
jgi:disulfide bond formation protein DsbB